MTIGIFINLHQLSAQGDYSLQAKRSFKNGKKAFDEGNNDEAIKLFTEAIAIAPSFTEAFLNRSILFLKAKEFEKASNDAKKAYSLNPIEPSIKKQLGKCYYELGYIDSAVFFIESGSQNSELSDDDLFYLANINIEIENYSEAIDAYTQLLERYPANSNLLNQRGISYFKIGEYLKAEEDFLAALEHNPENISIYANLANAAIEANDEEKALNYIDRGLEKATGETKVEFLILKGNYLYKNGKLAEAKEVYQEAYNLSKENPVILTNQASVMIEMGEYESAIEKCTMAIELNPEFMPAFFNRGIAYEMVKDTKQACLDWEEAFILGSTKAEEFLNSPACSE